MNRPLDEAEVTRAQDLLTARATEGVTDQELAELAALGLHEDASFDLAAASIDLALLRIEPMPTAIAEKILAAAGPAARSSGLVMPSTLAGVAVPQQSLGGGGPGMAHASVLGMPARMPASTQPPQPSWPQQPMQQHSLQPSGPQPMQQPMQPAPVIPIGSARRSRAPMLVAWTVATISVAAAATAILWVRQQKPKVETVTKVEYRDVVKMEQTPSPSAARAELLATAKDAKTISWTATKDAFATGASGDVVWSPSQQKGYMRFVNLAPNDPSKLQYQLWIFDKTRDDKFPVDGGVFDIPASGEVIVPISAKLGVSEAALFAVTVEAPGGVVVSKRERIVVTASPT